MRKSDRRGHAKVNFHQIPFLNILQICIQARFQGTGLFFYMKQLKTGGLFAAHQWETTPLSALVRNLNYDSLWQSQYHQHIISPNYSQSIHEDHYRIPDLRAMSYFVMVVIVPAARALTMIFIRSKLMLQAIYSTRINWWSGMTHVHFISWIMKPGLNDHHYWDLCGALFDTWYRVLHRGVNEDWLDVRYAPLKARFLGPTWGPSAPPPPPKKKKKKRKEKCANS